MKPWQVAACRAIDAAATRMKGQVLGYVDNDYQYVRGEVDIWLGRRDTNSRTEHKLFEPLHVQVWK